MFNPLLLNDKSDKATVHLRLECSSDMQVEPTMLNSDVPGKPVDCVPALRFFDSSTPQEE